MKRITTTAACIAASAVLAAQSPESLAPAADSVPPQALTIGIVPIHTAPDDPIGGPYGIWAATDSYKVSFDGDPTFIPYLGADYPENQELRWRTTAMKIGEVSLMSDTEVPQRWHSDTRYEYRYGQVTEAYDVRADGLEQTFTLLRRPAVAGDLVITGRIDTRMRAPAETDRHTDLVFADDNGLEVASYGKGWVLDSVGQKSAVLTSHVDGAVALRVDGSWLRDAIYPVTVDPLLSSLRVSSNNSFSPNRSIDCCADETAHDIGLVLTKDVSAVDSDAYMSIIQNGCCPTQVFADITSTWSTANTSIAAGRAPQKYCMVFDRTYSDGRKAVRAHLHSSRSYTLNSSVVFLHPPVGAYDWRPDVGGGDINMYNTNGFHFMIVFQREWTGNWFSNSAMSDIWGRTLQTWPTGGTLGTEFPIVASIFDSTDHERPSINQYAHQNWPIPTWMVVFQSFDNNAGPGEDWDVSGKLVRYPRTVSQATWTPRIPRGPGGPIQHHRLAPEVAGQDGRYLVTYTMSPVTSTPYKTTLAHGHSIGISRVEWPWSNVITRPYEQVLVGPQSNRDLLLGGAAFDRVTESHWAIMSTSDGNQGGSGSLFIERVGYDGVSTEAQTLPMMSGSRGEPGGVTFDDVDNQFVCGWGEESRFGHVYAYVTPFTYVRGMPPTRTGSSCSTALISWSGSTQIGSEFSGPHLTGSAYWQPAWVMVSLAPAYLNLTPFGLHGCSLLVDTGSNFVGSVPAVANGSGEVFAQISLPSWLLPDRVYFQWFHYPVGGSNLVSTNLLRVDLVR